MLPCRILDLMITLIGFLNSKYMYSNICFILFIVKEDENKEDLEDEVGGFIFSQLK